MDEEDTISRVGREADSFSHSQFSKNPVVPEVEGSFPLNSASEVVDLVAYVLASTASVAEVQTFASLKP